MRSSVCAIKLFISSHEITRNWKPPINAFALLWFHLFIASRKESSDELNSVNIKCMRGKKSLSIWWWLPNTLFPFPRNTIRNFPTLDVHDVLKFSLTPIRNNPKAEMFLNSLSYSEVMKYLFNDRSYASVFPRKISLDFPLRFFRSNFWMLKI